MSTTPVSRSSRFRVHSGAVLGTAHTIAQLAKDVTDIASVPFASQAVSLVLSMLEVAKGVKDNNDARVRLATTAATYLIELRPILDPHDSVDDMPSELRLRLERFYQSLVDLKAYLETMKKQNILKRIFVKDRISTILLDHEKALQASYNALQMWTSVNIYTLVRKGVTESDTDNIPRFDQAQIVLRGTIKANCDFFSKLELGELSANGDRQRVLVKRFANKTERDEEARKWRKLWHANLPQLAGCSNDRSATQFILFHDTYVTPQTAEIRSLAAFLLEHSRSYDAFSLSNTIVDFINNAISAIRHMQIMLNYNEDETAQLAEITKYTVNGDGRIIVTPPLHALTGYGGGVRNSIFNRLFPVYGTSEATMRYYFADLDCIPTHTTLSKVLDGERLDKWALLNNLWTQLRFSSNRLGYEKPEHYVMPETRHAYADYSVNIKPGDFGVLVPGQREEYAYRRVDDSAANSSVLFEYQSRHRLLDRDEVEFEVVCEQPKTWRIDRLTDGCVFLHEREQRLTRVVHRSKRFLELSAPKECDEDELVFVVGVWHIRYYQYALRSESIGESQVADVYANLPNWNSDEILFSHCAPGFCLDSCDLGNRVSIDKNLGYMRIEYVTVPVARCTVNIKNSEDHDKIKYKEYESINPRQTMIEKRFSAEWP